jgi:hypothetical protein
VTTVEFAEHKIGLAVTNFTRAGLTRHISIVHDDGGRVLECSADSAFDLVFLDSERPEYPGWWQQGKSSKRQLEMSFDSVSRVRLVFFVDAYDWTQLLIILLLPILLTAIKLRR